MTDKIDWQRMNSIIAVNDAQADYLFSEQLEKIKRLCDEIITSNRLQHESILGVVGERGSGKSSFLNTVKIELQKSNYYVMDVLDPSVFGDSMSIIELFVSQIYKYIIENETDNYESTARDLHELLQDITKLLADFQVGNESFYRDNTYGEVLKNIKERVNLPKMLQNLVEKFLNYLNSYVETKSIKYKGIVLCIDDVDLVSNEKIFKLLEDVRKYLAGNVIVITAFHSLQLFDAVLHEKLQENNILLTSNSITVDQVRNQVARYLEKLIPVNNRVELYDSGDLLKKNYTSVLAGIIKDDEAISEQAKKQVLNNYFASKGLPIDESVSVRDWIYQALSTRLRLKLEAVDNRENTLYNLPVNLRGLLQLIRLIVDGMDKVNLLEEDFEEPDNNIRALCKENAIQITKNLEMYENYLYSNLREILPTDLSNIIEQWKKCKYNAKNYLICDELLKKLENNNTENLLGMPKYYLLQQYNISIGDVYSVIEVYKSVFGEKEKIRYFIYSLKVLYSIELLSNYLKACICFCENSNENNESLDIYLTLINAKIMPDSFVYFTANANAELTCYFDKKVFEGNKLEALKICKNLFFSSVAVNSNLRRVIPTYSALGQKKEVVQSSKARPHDTFKYSHLYDYDISDHFDDFVDKTFYPIDPFAFAGQKWYIEESFFRNYYVFYSLFDIDALVRINYGRGYDKKVHAISSLIQRTHNILSGHEIYSFIKLRDSEKELIAGMFMPIFHIDALRKERHFNYNLNETNEVVSSAFFDVRSNDVTKLPKHKFKKLLELLLDYKGLANRDIEYLLNMFEYYENSTGIVKKEDKKYVANLINSIDFDFDKDEL